jgi:hypothetical protein
MCRNRYWIPEETQSPEWDVGITGVILSIHNSSKIAVINDLYVHEDVGMQEHDEKKNRYYIGFLWLL